MTAGEALSREQAELLIECLSELVLEPEDDLVAAIASLRAYCKTWYGTTECHHGFDPFQDCPVCGDQGKRIIEQGKGK